MWTRVAENLVRHPRGKYYLRASVGGKVVVRSLRTNNIAEARARRDRELARLRALAGIDARSATTIGEFLELLDRREAANPRSKAATHVAHDQFIRALRDTLPLDRPFRSWSADDAVAWWESFAVGRSPQRANNCLGTLRRAVRDAVDGGALVLDPTRRLQRLHVPQSNCAIPSESDLARVIAEVAIHSPHAALFMELLSWSGLRVAEARALEWRHVGKDWLEVDGGIIGTKNRRTRRVPIGPGLRSVLNRLGPGSGSEPVLALRTPWANIQRSCERIKIRPFRVHDLRHVFACRCIERGIDIPTLSRWLGHSDGGALALRVYGHLRDEHATKQASLLGPS